MLGGESCEGPTQSKASLSTLTRLELAEQRTFASSKALFPSLLLAPLVIWSLELPMAEEGQAKSVSKFRFPLPL